MAAKSAKIFSLGRQFRANKKRFVSFNRTCSSYGQTRQTTVDDNEVFKFSELSNEFWDINGPFQALHAMNKMRVPLIRNTLSSETKGKIVSEPLKHKTILDIGCGGGILSEPLARLGASVVGIDASEEAIQVAQRHAKDDPAVCDRVDYRSMTAEELVDQSESFDAVVASEVIEHVDNQKFFVKTCAQLTKPGGALIFTTINRTPQSFALAILGAEYVLNIVERGTHDWNKFIPDDELASLVIHNGFTIRAIHGLCYNPLQRKWSKVHNTSVNYALVAHKELLNRKDDEKP